MNEMDVQHVLLSQRYVAPIRRMILDTLIEVVPTIQSVSLVQEMQG